MSNVSLIDGHDDEPKKQTNYDRIRNMSVEEMAEFLYKYTPISRLPKEVDKIWQNNNVSIFGALKQWLESEVDTE